MNLEVIADGASRFAASVEKLTKMIGPADRARPLRDCCAGLLVSGGRRSVEPMGAVTAPAEASVQHQNAPFCCQCAVVGRAVLAKVREMAVPAMERHGPIETWIFEDTSFLPSTVPTRLACTVSIAGSLASKPVARW